MVGVCIIFLIREFTVLYIAVKNQERINAFNKMMEKYPENDEIDKNFIIIEQHKIIDQMKTTNFYSEKLPNIIENFTYGENIIQINENYFILCYLKFYHDVFVFKPCTIHSLSQKQ